MQWEMQMGAVLIKCPKTGKAIRTGIDLPKQAFEHSTFTNNATSCPECGRSHTWSKKDAWVEDKGA